MENQTRKVKVLNTSYDRHRNMVKWKIQDIEEKKEIILAWSGNDLGFALGIDQVIPPDAMEDFCGKMVGKEFSLVMQSERLGINASNIGDATEDEFGNFNDKFFPYQELMGKILEEEREQDER
jgi:hypothetical protein